MAKGAHGQRPFGVPKFICRGGGEVADFFFEAISFTAPYLSEAIFEVNFYLLGLLELKKLGGIHTIPLGHYC